ncbi:MAG: molybdenum cofactor cytidylyltransferase [Paraglaciecola sp.]|jgi:molybdenum cofactor cytidylyltransferase
MSSNFQHKIPFSISSKGRLLENSDIIENLKKVENENIKRPEEIISDISILILAAGNSSRLGQPKQLVNFGGKPLICHIIEQALFVKMRSVFVVLGGNKSLILPKITHLPVTIVDNENWAKGMGSSIATGLKAIQEQNPETTGIVTLLCDQPFVSADLIHQIIQKQEETQAAIVASSYSGNAGVPAFFSQSIFKELLNLSEKGGARKIIRQHLSEIECVSFSEGIFDIDTPEDLNRIQEWSKILQKKNTAPFEDWD